MKKAYFLNGEDDYQKNINYITEEIKKEPIDLGLIGIGENTHIAFNDPPANFETKESFIIVKLDEDCKKQQVREGWFKTVEQVPKFAITMTVHQIMQCEHIVSCVPNIEKANAIKLALENDVTNQIPATILKTHPSWTLFIDSHSASKVDNSILESLKES